ncbi:MAG: MgtC/SapB family protein [Acidobacteria bacterium]|nr:MgtC/SapB family protein [Acidobacteriota bacterium]
MLLELATLKEAAVAVAIGLMMGLEREHAGFEKEQDWLEAHPKRRAQDAEALFGGGVGARSFALLALLGWMSTLAGGPWLPVATLGFTAVLLGLHYHHTGGKDRGITTEIAALSAPVLGMLIRQDMLLAVALGVIVTLLLLSKPWFRGWIPKLHREDLTAAVQLLIVFAVALPLLPVKTLDPWHVLSPRKLGWMVALIAGADFAGYALNRALGAQRGAVLTGVVGGLVSSTAVTLGMARQVAQEAAMRDPATVAVLLACSVMGARVYALVALLGGAELASRLAPAMALMVAFLLGASWWIARRPHGGRPDEVPMRNPFHLKRALAWGAALALVLVASAAARAWFGDRGLMVTALISGFADVDPLTLAVSHQVRETGLPAATAGVAIVAAISANTVSKAALAWINGGSAFGRRLTLLLGLSLALALGASLAG